MSRLLQSVLKTTTVLTIGLVFLAGCSSGQLKARKEQRDKVAQSSKFYCDFVDGSQYPDLEVHLNLEMAKKCASPWHIF